MNFYEIQFSVSKYHEKKYFFSVSNYCMFSMRKVFPQIIFNLLCSNCHFYFFYMICEGEFPWCNLFLLTKYNTDSRWDENPSIWVAIPKKWYHEPETISLNICYAMKWNIILKMMLIYICMNDSTVNTKFSN